MLLAIPSHYSKPENHGSVTFSENRKWIQSLDITLEGGRAGPGGRSNRRGPPQVNVGSFTKRSEVKRRATLTNK